jgi:hypothetical protein
MKYLFFVFLGMGVYGLLSNFYGAALLAFLMAGLVYYGHTKMQREEVIHDTKSDRDFPSQK